MSEFNLTERHIKLLRKLIIYWEDGAYEGAPAVDLKRPFGNSGGVATDIAEILGEEPARCPHCDEVIEDGNKDDHERLYRELEQAIKIVLNRVEDSAAGKYRKAGYHDWTKVTD